MNAEISDWMRPSELDDAGPGFSLWGSQGILPAGVNQGSLGDCWFLAACAALAETPERIRHVFAGREKDSQGFYVFKFYVMGVEKYAVVDDRLPTKDAEEIYGPGYSFSSTGSRYGTFMSGVSENGAWWLPILEKAYAKLTKTYADMNGGNEWEALRAMTGMPVEGYESDELTSSEIMDIITWADNKNYIMTAGCHHSQYGLVAGHAYSLIGVNSATNRIIVRNPWGSENYYGPGSD